MPLQNGIGDTNDYWRVELVGGAEGDVVKTVASVLRFRHNTHGCYLHSHGTQLPKWWDPGSTDEFFQRFSSLPPSLPCSLPPSLPPSLSPSPQGLGTA